MLSKRMKRLKKELDGKCDAILLGGIDTAYLVGLPPQVSGRLFWEFGKRPILFTGDYYQAVSARPVVKPVRARKEEVYDIVNSSSARKIGVNASRLAWASRDIIRKRVKGKRLVDVSSVVNEINVIKEPSEVRRMKKAARITLKVFEEVRKLIKPGVKEKEIAREVVSFFAEEADGISFYPIVASGRHALYIHAYPSERRIGRRDTVIVDIGCMYRGFCSDFTRTFLVNPGKRQIELENWVLSAWEIAAESAYPGMSAGELYGIVDEAFGPLSKYWPYGLGHGIGMEVHEYPSLARGSKDFLREGMTFTIEPGLHIPGVGGYRHEDTGLMTRKGWVALG